MYLRTQINEISVHSRHGRWKIYIQQNSIFY